MTYIINLDEYADIGTHWIPLHLNDNTGESSNTVTYFDSSGVEHIPQETKKLIDTKNFTTNIYRLQA